MNANLDTYTDEHGIKQPTRAMDRPGLCERTGGHVVVKPRRWQPGHPGQRGTKPYASVPCARCGAAVIVYNPLQDGVRWMDQTPPPPQAA